MFKKIFKAAKDLIRSPVGQLGIGLLAPALFPTVSPALLQGGIGLLSGAKPEDVLRGVALGAGQAALRGGMSGGGGINEFFMGQPRQIAPAAQPRQGSAAFARPTVGGAMGQEATDATLGISRVLEGAGKKRTWIFRKIWISKNR